MAFKLPPRYGADNFAYKHGLYGTPTHLAWRNMKNRCYDPKNISYPNYGGRGIRVCAEWLYSFVLFYRAMGERPSDCTLERINSNGNYEPGNVRWATRKEQARNKRNIPLVTAFGESLPAAEWAERFGVASGTIRWRLRRGWAPENAVTVGPDAIGNRGRS